MEKKKIYLYAYTQQNLGDDLFIDILCSRYPKIQFYIVCGVKAKKPFKKIDNLKTISSITILDKILRKINRRLVVTYRFQRWLFNYCNAIINIGGSIFIEDQEWLNKIKKYETLINTKKPSYIIGSNFGPYKEDEFIEGFKRIFKNVNDVCFRDQYSYKLFSGLPNVRYAADIVFSMKKKKSNITRKHVIISVINLSMRNELKKHRKDYEEQILKISREFVNKGYTVYLMGFCGNEGDNDAIIKILSKLDCSEKAYIKPYYYNGNIDEALSLIEESSFVVATRFHSMILGWLYNKPVFPIIYSNKMLNVIKDVGFNDYYITIDKIHKINAHNVVESLLNSKPINVEKQKISANMQFKQLDELLLSDKNGEFYET